MKHWKEEFDTILPKLGHRNWILIVDAAYPLQSSESIDTIITNDEILEVTKYVFSRVDEAKHIKGKVYFDKELDYLTDDLCCGADELKNQLSNIVSSEHKEVILHEEIFKKLDNASDLFNVVVLKTNCLIPYSSIFIELDCGYWNKDAEIELRKRII